MTSIPSLPISKYQALIKKTCSLRESQVDHNVNEPPWWTNSYFSPMCVYIGSILCVGMLLKCVRIYMSLPPKVDVHYSRWVCTSTTRFDVIWPRSWIKKLNNILIDYYVHYCVDMICTSRRAAGIWYNIWPSCLYHADQFIKIVTVDVYASFQPVP